MIVQALSRLAPEQRAVIVLRHLLEYTPGEIAELLELPRGTVNSRLRRGLDEPRRPAGAGAVSERELRRALASLRVPGEEQAETRTWSVVAAGYAGSRADAEPRPRRGLPLRAVAVVAGVAAVTAAVLTAPGQAVLDSVREAIGVEHAQPALFSLPASGSLLVASPETGTWLVRPDGSKRRLGDYREASWSPFGRFVVAARTDELVALEPNGRVRWSLARPGLRFPRWGGSRTDTRIAYLSGPRLQWSPAMEAAMRTPRFPGVAAVPPAWQPARSGKPFMLAYADGRGRIHGYEPDGRRESFQTRPAPIPSKLEWSSDGRLLLAVSPHALRVYDAAGRLVARDDPSDATRDVDATFLPAGGDVAVLRAHGAQSDVFVLRTGRLLFRTTGRLTQVVASPDGRWLLAGWPAADQWLFIRTTGARRVTASANVAGQFGGFPRVDGWCCA